MPGDGAREGERAFSADSARDFSAEAARAEVGDLSGEPARADAGDDLSTELGRGDLTLLADRGDLAGVEDALLPLVRSFAGMPLKPLLSLDATLVVCGLLGTLLLGAARNFSAGLLVTVRGVTGADADVLGLAPGTETESLAVFLVLDRGDWPTEDAGDDGGQLSCCTCEREDRTSASESGIRTSESSIGCYATTKSRIASESRRPRGTTHRTTPVPALNAERVGQEQNAKYTLYTIGTPFSTTALE